MQTSDMKKSELEDRVIKLEQMIDQLLMWQPINAYHATVEEAKELLKDRLSESTIVEYNDFVE